MFVAVLKLVCTVIVLAIIVTVALAEATQFARWKNHSVDD
jgi:hypothetical protein